MFPFNNESWVNVKIGDAEQPTLGTKHHPWRPHRYLEPHLIEHMLRYRGPWPPKLFLRGQTIMAEHLRVIRGPRPPQRKIKNGQAKPV